MRQFDVSVMITSDEDEELGHDATVMVELPEGVSVDEEQLATLAKQIAGVVRVFVAETYQGAELTVCT